MAAASGPVPNSSGEMEVDELKPTEQPKPVEIDQSDDFKVPDIGLPRTEKKNSDSSPTVTNGTDVKNRQPSSPSQPSAIKQSRLSPAEQMKQSQVSIPYKEPIWSGLPPETDKYSLEVLKTGIVIENLELGKKPWLVFGRLPSCDVCMEHPSMSRHHAVLQYCDTPGDGYEKGWYLYDLDSTHGTWVNKVKVRPKVYHRLHVGHVIKFGGSSRLYILQGPEEDREPESELSVTELKAQTAKLKREAELLKQAEEEEEEERERERQKIFELRGCSWGMGEDAAEEEESGESPFASMVPEHEHLYVDDPKKALKGFYEREGCDLPDYQFTEVGFGKHRCVVELPVDGPNGEPLIAEATVSGKKKEAVIACALEACRLLDMHGLLYASKHESRKRKQKNWEEDDFYDSDEDTFLDRTGTIEKKRLLRMRKSGKDTKAETYETLLPKHEEVVKRIAEIEMKLEQAKAQTEALGNEEEDALDAYMTAIKAGVMDTKTRLSLKRELLTLRKEEQRFRRLVNIAKPSTLPELKKLTPVTPKPPVALLPASGVRKITVAKGPKKPLPRPVGESVHQDDSKFEEEVEEDEQDENITSKKAKDTSTETSSKQSEPAKLDSTKQRDSDTIRLRDSHNTVTDKDSSGFAKKMKTGKSSAQKSSSIPPQQKSSKGSVKEEATPQAVKGPTLPPGMELPSVAPDDAAVPSSSFENKPNTKIQGSPVAKKKKKPDLSAAEYDASDPDYAVWMPPQDQTGDGRTNLNDKLGY